MCLFFQFNHERVPVLQFQLYPPVWCADIEQIIASEFILTTAYIFLKLSAFIVACR